MGSSSGYAQCCTPMENLEPNELSLASCRRILGSAGNHLSDEQLRGLRTGMYELAGCAVDAFAQCSAADPEGRVLGMVPEPDRDGVEERAAVLEFDANLTRGAATRAAVAAYLRTTNRQKGRFRQP
jgi:hypothetical protein